MGELWRWDAKLSWELFSEAVYCYRQILNGNVEHKTHMFCKSGIFSIVTSLEALTNEILLNPPYSWTKTKLEKKENNLDSKIHFLTHGMVSPKSLKAFESIKYIRNHFLVHHKRRDQRYVVEMNVVLLLDGIEAVQEIIARIAFNHSMPFPYWICGVNFINPITNDITLSHDVEFWRHIKGLGIFQCPDTFLSPSGDLKYPTKWEEYTILYRGLWELLKESSFKFDMRIKDNRFPKMPYLSCNYWEESR